MKRSVHTVAVIATLMLWAMNASALERFPPPDFESGYVPPSATVPPPRPASFEYVDTAVLAGTLALATYLALSVRSRIGLLVLGLFSLGYFGFWRKGCICSVGAIQDVALSLAGGNGVLQMTTIAFFVLPLAFTLFFGRVFCAAVCPLGAIQDVVLIRPVKVPRWLEHSLGLLAYVYLGLAVVFAVTGSAFIICRYDPFVSFFRFSGNTTILALGSGFLITGTLIGRPYCRFLCPYGALHRLFSTVSMKHSTITPDECIQCKLCENACPYGAILKPSEEAGTGGRRAGIRLLAAFMVLLPVLITGGLLLGTHLGPWLSNAHPTVKLAERVLQEQNGIVSGTTDASEAFYKTGRAPDELYSEAAVLTKSFVKWGQILGVWLALVIGLKFISLSIRRRRTGYEPDKAKCVSCGRCFMSCPHERVRRKKASGLLESPRSSPASNSG